MNHTLWQCGLCLGVLRTKPAEHVGCPACGGDVERFEGPTATCGGCQVIVALGTPEPVAAIAATIVATGVCPWCLAWREARE